MPAKYKALILSQEVGLHLNEVDCPELQEGEALVRIKAASLNHRDEFIREGLYPNIQLPAITGSDGCGIVEEVNESNYQSWVGKEVIINPNLEWGDKEEAQSKNYHILGMPTRGLFGEYAIVPAKNLYPKPGHLSAQQAAALPLAGLTSYRAMIVKGAVKPAQKVLITGIGGGVAQMALQFADAMNADVFVTSGNNEKIEKAKELGARDGANYKSEGWHKSLKKASGGFDLIIDSAGGDEWNQLIDILNPGGKLVFYGATNGSPTNLNLHKIFWKQQTLMGTTMGSDNDFEAMLAFVEKHKVAPTVDSIRPFDEIVSAFDQMNAGKQFGKLVVKMD